MRSLAFAASAAVALWSSVALAQPAVGIQSAAPAPAQVAEGIPPNCLLNPWTHKLECVIWPTCTLDPWTGRMNCPVPRPPVSRMG